MQNIIILAFHTQHSVRLQKSPRPQRPEIVKLPHFQTQSLRSHLLHPLHWSSTGASTAQQARVQSIACSI